MRLLRSNVNKSDIWLTVMKRDSTKKEWTQERISGLREPIRLLRGPCDISEFKCLNEIYGEFSFSLFLFSFLFNPPFFDFFVIL
jgi:hypothetical protein